MFSVVHTQLDGDINFAIGFPSPPPGDYVSYHQYIDDVLPPETPYLYGLHPNAEIGFLTTTSETLFRTVLEMQPRGSGTGDGGGMTREEKVKRLATHYRHITFNTLRDADAYTVMC